VRVLIALGGNAMTSPHGRAGPEDQKAAITLAMDEVAAIVASGAQVLLTHGNGPQVGNLLLQNELTLDSVPSMPLDVLVANTEGFLGYVLQQALLNQLRRRQIKRYVVTMITQVLVEGDDPAFQNPSKPIGPFLTKEQAEDRRDRLGWKIVEDSGRGWRRLVASPRPVRVVQRFMIRDSARAGHIVVACGGGGIPIIRNQEKDYVGVEAVIDKDLTSSVLAAEIGAELLIILTDVPQVYVNYGQPSQRALGAVTLEEIEALQSEGHFGRGSMGPKVEAIINFLKAGGKRGLVTSPACLADALDGRAGTHFVGKI